MVHEGDASMSNTSRGVVVALTALALSLAVAACAPTAESPEANPEGPGGSGTVTAAPEGLTPDTVTPDTACELATASPTLVQLGVVGTPASTQFSLDLSYCDLAFTASEFVDSGLSVSVLTASDVALTASSDPTISGSTLVLLPDVGVDGHYAAIGPGVDPAANPTSGAIIAARGELGVSVAWATGPTVPFATFEQIVLELLDALQ